MLKNTKKLFFKVITSQKFFQLNKQRFSFSKKITQHNLIKISQKYLNTAENEKEILKMVNSLLVDLKHEDGTSLNTSKLISNVKIEDRSIKIMMDITKDYRKIKHLIEEKFKGNFILKNYNVTINIAPKEKTSTSNIPKGLQKVKSIIAVSSCKGGVGKSTVACNLAYSLHLNGLKVGIYDADIYGPSLPTMVSPENKELLSYEDAPDMIIPIEFSGVKLMSYGFAAPNKKAIVRGPIVSNLVTQLVKTTDWGELDYLVVDMPPGTGDINISLCQDLKFSGAVIVTTPQKLSFIDVVKGIEMFDELKVPIISVIENMSYFVCDKCDEKHYVFGRGYANMLKQQFGIEESYDLPIEGLISRTSDAGIPFVLAAPDSSQTKKIMTEAAANIHKKMEEIKQKGEDSKVKVEFDPTEGYIHVKTKDTDKKIDPLHLRKKCICAACIDEFSGAKLLKDKNIPEDVYPLKMEEKGNYAVAVVWSDGHRSSIYPYKRLLSKEIESLV